MSQAPRDQNRVPAALGVTNDASLTPEPLRVDPTTKRLLVDAIATVDQGPAASATVSSVAGSASAVTLLAANANRVAASIFNDSTAILYVKLGSSASTSSFTERLVPYASYELMKPIYVGEVTGIWASATGNARITEEE